MSNDLEAMKAAFLARGGAVTKAPAAAAYGVDTEADKLKAKQAKAKARKDKRAQEMADLYDDEGAHERYREAVNDAYMSGGSSARDDVMSMGVHSFRRRSK